MVQVLEKHDCHEYLDLYKKMGIAFVLNGYRKPKWKTSLEKKENWHPFSNLFFLGNQKPYNKSNPLQQTFLEDLVLYVT